MCVSMCRQKPISIWILFKGVALLVKGVYRIIVMKLHAMSTDDHACNE